LANSSSREIADEIRKQVALQGTAELKADLRVVADEIIGEMRAISPEDLDDGNAVHYKDSFKSRMLPATRGRLPVIRVSNTDPLAGVVEDGSGELAQRPQGGSSPAHHIFSIVAFRHRGTVDGQGDAEDE
jgi:hypothetical protein